MPFVVQVIVCFENENIDDIMLTYGGIFIIDFGNDPTFYFALTK